MWNYADYLMKNPIWLNTWLTSNITISSEAFDATTFAAVVDIYALGIKSTWTSYIAWRTAHSTKAGFS